MKTEESTQPDYGPLRPSLAVGLTALLLLTVASLMGATTSNVTTVAPQYPDQETGKLRAGPVVTIGLATGLSGPIARFAWRQANSVQLAVDQTNAAGGIEIGGTTYTVSLITADASPFNATTTANTLLDASAVAVVGHLSSQGSMAAQPVYNEAGVAMVNPSATIPDLTDQAYHTTFRVISRDDTITDWLVTYFRNVLGLDRAAIVEQPSFPVGWIYDAFEDGFTGHGGTITSRRAVTSTADYTDTLTIIQAEEPDVIFYADFDPDAAGLLSKTAHELGMTDVILAWDTGAPDRTVLDEYVTQAELAAESDCAGMHYRATDEMPGYDELASAYRVADFANYGDDPDTWGAYAYDAAKIVIAAIDRTDSTDPSDIRDAIAGTTDYQGVVGTYEGFDAKGDVIPQRGGIEQYRDGQWVSLHPSQVFLPFLLRNLHH